jgi:hypothetical protein
LCQYPVYADKNITTSPRGRRDAAEDPPARRITTHFAKQFEVEQATAPTQVETIINHRVPSDKRSSPASARRLPQPLVDREAIRTDATGDHG